MDTSVESFRDSLKPELRYLYERSLDDVHSFEEQLSGNDLSAREVLRAHFCLCEFFSDEHEGLGGVGLKDSGLLTSALSRQFVGFGGQSKWTTIHDKAATLLYGLVMNHPFHDANKRTAYLSTIHYLFTNGFSITVTEKTLEDLTVLVANRGLSKFRRYKQLKKRSSDPEVEFLSHYLRQNTRKIDKQQYIVTYRELDRILQRYDAHLENPKNNSIDLMQWQEVEVRVGGLFNRRMKKQKELRRVCSLGFPGWSKQVGKGRLKHVRQELGLTAANGVDSQSFFNGVDDMRVLMGMYEGALRRLAFR